MLRRFESFCRYVNDNKLISIFADGEVWFNAEVIKEILDQPELNEMSGQELAEALRQTFDYLENETVKSITDSMAEQMLEE